MAPDPTQIMDTIFQNISNTTPTRDSLAALSTYLKGLTPKETREAALAASLSSGQDPLSVLSVPGDTLGVLYILSARLHSSNPQAAPPIDVIEHFCKNFDPEQARYAPDRVTALAKGIQKFALGSNNPRAAITPLYHLTTRYPPTPSHLTTLHPIFTLTCLQASHPIAAVPVLEHPITAIDTNLSELTYNDNLVYHYTGGVALAMLRRWAEAEEFFEICITAPGTVPAALQMEALKKLRMVQLIARGRVGVLPKYTNAVLLRQYKGTPYHHFASAYPHNVGVLREILAKEQGLFSAEKNLGLVKMAMERAPRWALKKLTNTYLSLNLADIGREVKISNEEEVRGLLLDMIESGDISASIAADGSVTFSDPPPQFTRAQVDAVLANAQEQSELLEYLDKEMGKSKEFLSKAAKLGREGDMGAFATDEDVFSHIGGGGGGVWSMDD